MLYNPPSGSTDANAPFVGKNVAAGTQGSKIPPAAVEYPQREAVAVIAASGQSPTNGVLVQMAMALARGVFVGNLTGTGDLAVATLGVVFPQLLQGMRIGGVATAANTVTNPKLRVVNLGTLGGYIDFPILREDGSQPAIGDIKVGRRYRYEADGAGNVMITGGGLGVGSAGNYVPIYAARTYYVSPTGSDLNDGLTSSTALATINAARDKIAKLNLNGQTVTIQLADGTYAACSFNAPWFGNGMVVLQGNLTTPANVKIQTSSGDAVLVQGGAILWVQGFQPKTDDGAYGCVTAAGNGSAIHQLGAMDYPQCNARYHIDAIANGLFRFYANYTISGGTAASHWFTSNYGNLGINNNLTATITLSGNPSFSFGFAAADGGAIPVTGATYSGAATGYRYRAYGGGRIITGGNPNGLPGSINGDATTGYVT